MDTSPEDIASWLARETGHEAEESADMETKEGPGEETQGYGLPNPDHEKLRHFFDGLNVEKELTAKRRADALTPLDNATELRKAIGQQMDQATPTQEGY